MPGLQVIDVAEMPLGAEVSELFVTRISNARPPGLIVEAFRLALPKWETFGFFDNDDRLLGAISADIGQPDSEIQALAVKDEVRGCGIGGLLIKAVEAHARFSGGEEMYVLASNASGPMYEHLGYVPLHEGGRRLKKNLRANND